MNGMTQRAAGLSTTQTPIRTRRTGPPRQQSSVSISASMDHHNGFANRFGKGTIALHTPLILQDETVMHGLC